MFPERIADHRGERDRRLVGGVERWVVEHVQLADRFEPAALQYRP
jgi:hypothetical protein